MKKTLIKGAMSFYKDREEKGEEDLFVKEEEAENVIMSFYIRFQTPFYMFLPSFIILDLTFLCNVERGRNIILGE